MEGLPWIGMPLEAKYWLRLRLRGRFSVKFRLTGLTEQIILSFSPPTCLPCQGGALLPAGHSPVFSHPHGRTGARVVPESWGHLRQPPPPLRPIVTHGRNPHRPSKPSDPIGKDLQKPGRTARTVEESRPPGKGRNRIPFARSPLIPRRSMSTASLASGQRRHRRRGHN
jgi:hypothetical protein